MEIKKKGGILVGTVLFHVVPSLILVHATCNAISYFRLAKFTFILPTSSAENVFFSNLITSSTFFNN